MKDLEILSKVMERERPLLYFFVWDQSDRRGVEFFTQQSIRHNLFILKPKQRIGNVWYSKKELEQLESEALKKINADPSLGLRMIEHARTQWQWLRSYLNGEHTLSNAEDLLELIRVLTSFWYTMNTVYFHLPDRPELNGDFRSGLISLREDTQESSMPLATAAEKEFARLFPEYARYAMCVAPQDVSVIGSGNGTQLIPVLEDRFENGCILLDEVVYPYAALSEELSKRGLALEEIDTEAKEIKGAIGYKGIVRGPARIVRTKGDLERVQEGDILVARLTDPSYMSVMLKTAGFVTDEGGIMSHAAIVAREMKKPCVIGTKIATEVLKDGDMVEVDANNGIVRKIS